MCYTRWNWQDAIVAHMVWLSYTIIGIGQWARTQLPATSPNSRLVWYFEFESQYFRHVVCGASTSLSWHLHFWVRIWFRITATCSARVWMCVQHVVGRGWPNWQVALRSEFQAATIEMVRSQGGIVGYTVEKAEALSVCCLLRCVCLVNCPCQVLLLLQPPRICKLQSVGRCKQVVFE